MMRGVAQVFAGYANIGGIVTQTVVEPDVGQLPYLVIVFQ